MIVDTLENAKLYKNFSIDIFEGLRFLQTADSDIDLGVHFINDSVKAIVECYETDFNSPLEFESHKHVVDIQYPIIGTERVLWSPIAHMEEKTPYNEKYDQAVFTNSNSESISIDIGNRVFAIMFENDGHSPKHCVYSSELIKKITIKVLI